MCLRILKICTGQNTSTYLQPQPTVKKITHTQGDIMPCIVSVPKMNWPIELNDFWWETLASHLMKTLFILGRCCSGESHPLLHQAHSNPDKGNGTASILFLDRVLLTPAILEDTLNRMRVDSCLVTCISSYLME